MCLKPISKIETVCLTVLPATKPISVHRESASGVGLLIHSMVSHACMDQAHAACLARMLYRKRQGGGRGHRQVVHRKCMGSLCSLPTLGSHRNHVGKFLNGSFHFVAYKNAMGVDRNVSKCLGNWLGIDRTGIGWLGCHSVNAYTVCDAYCFPILPLRPLPPSPALRRLFRGEWVVLKAITVGENCTPSCA